MMCGFALVCSDPPVVSGYSTNITLKVLGGNGVEPLHGDDQQQTSPSSLLLLTMSASTLVTPRTVHCEEQAARQWGIEAEAIWLNSLHHPHVDWGCRKQTALLCPGAKYAKCTVFEQP